MAVDLQLTADSEAGADWSFTYTHAIPGYPGVPGPPVDVTGYHAKMTVRSSYGDGAVVTVDDQLLGGITIGTTDGTIHVAMTAEQTATLPGRGVYDILVTPVSGEPFRLCQGNLLASQAVTK